MSFYKKSKIALHLRYQAAQEMVILNNLESSDAVSSNDSDSYQFK